MNEYLFHKKLSQNEKNHTHSIPICKFNHIKIKFIFSTSLLFEDEKKSTFLPTIEIRYADLSFQSLSFICCTFNGIYADCIDRRVAYTKDSITHHHPPQERQSPTMPKLQGNQPHKSRQ